MYKIYADNTLIYDSTLEDYKINKGEITLEIGKAGSFVFSMYPDNPFYDRIVRMKTIITVYRDSDIIFKGRALKTNDSFFNCRVVTCEGELNFLLDSIIRPYEFSGPPLDFLTKIVQEHNSQVDESKRFEVGLVTIDDPNNYISRANSEYEDALSNLSGKLTGTTLGGYLFITHDKDGRSLLNYYGDFHAVAKQSIEFGENLRDYTKTIDAENITTVLIPLGAVLQDSEGNDLDERLTIESVNNGRDYIEDAEAVETYGRIEKVYTWDDVTVASNLLTKGQNKLKELILLNTTIDLTAIDLHLLDRSIESYGYGMYIQVKSKPHNLDALMLCNKQTINLLKPETDSLTLGYSYKSFTDSSVTDKREIKEETDKKVNELSKIYRDLNSNIGMYSTEEILPDGSKIYYIHDNADITKSSVIWKMTAESIAISTDGGRNYVYGLTSDGDAILNRIYAVGIDATNITAGTISDKDHTNYWNLGTGELVINRATINSELISVEVTASNITTGKIQDKAGANYWDLDNSKLVITNAEIDSALFKNINADNITAGTISDANNYNYWNLLTGEMVITKATIDSALLTDLNATNIVAGRISDSKNKNYWDLDTGEMVINSATINSSLVSLSVTADDITTGRIEAKTGGNYWDLDTGEMVIKKATIDSSLISVEVTADNITTGRITDRYGKNYWDLDSGELVINNATIDSALLKNIDADNIVAGRISDGTSGNYWDLDTGTLVINKATINSSLISVDITADEIITGRITDKRGKNYWDLDTGEMNITNATISSALLKNIDADNISTGRITAKTGGNYWDLDTGEMVINKATIDSSLISVSITADEITTGRITDSTGDNYWDLDTGKMVITDATIDSALLKNIDADNITTGRITAKSGNNYWDLDTGALVINNATINTSLNADKITAGTLDISRIDLDELFSQQITATNLTLTGTSKIISENGSRTTSITVENGAMEMFVGSGDASYAIHNGERSYYYGIVYGEDYQDNNYVQVDQTGLTLYKRDGSQTYIKHDKLYGHSGATLDWRGPVKFSNSTLADFVIEQKTSGVWTYEKWNSGKLKIWGNIPISNMTIDTPLGTWYRSADGVISSIEQAYPVSFTNVPVVSGTFVSSNSASAMLWCSKSSESRMKTYSPGYYLIRPDTKTGVTGYISIIAKGKWK